MIRPRQTAALASALILLASAAAAKREAYVYGPEPDFAEYKRLGEAAVRAALPDPENWSFEWPSGYIRYRWDNKGDFPGYMTCGIMRAHVPVKGRNPRTNFIVVIDHGAVKKVDIAPRPSNDIRNQVCTDWVATGKLPPARMMEAAQPASDDAELAALGLKVRVMPEGAYVIETMPGSVSRRAGLAPGMVITRANGVALAGLGAAIPKILASDAATLALETVTGEHFTLTRAQ